jgi:hypothetical protein
MRTLNKTILKATIGLLLFSACNKAEIIPSPVSNNTIFEEESSTELTNFFKSNLNQMTQRYSLDVSDGINIVTTKGATISIPKNALTTPNGNYVKGIVDIEFIELYDRASMLLANKPTVASMPDGSQSQLITGGEYYLRITQNGKELIAKQSIEVNLNAKYTNGFQEGMQFFDGSIDGNNELTWKENKVKTISNKVDSLDFEKNYSYKLLSDTWGWTNCDRYSSDPREKTNIKVFLNQKYTLKNTEIYITYDGESRALGMMNIYNKVEKYFSTYQVPIGVQLHLIALTVDNGQLKYSVKPITVDKDGVFYMDGFKNTSIDELTDLINTLP